MYLNQPDKNKLEEFRAKAECLSESLKSRAEIDFEWCPMTYQQYDEQNMRCDVKFDVVHFMHSLYYAGLETAPEHCFEKELGPRGVILCVIRGEASAFVKYFREFSSQGLILNLAAYYSSKDVTDVAKRTAGNTWSVQVRPRTVT